MKINSNLPFRRESNNKEQKEITITKCIKEQKTNILSLDTLDLISTENKNKNTNNGQMLQELTDNLQIPNNLDNYIKQTNNNDPSEAKKLLKQIKEDILNSPEKTMDCQSNHSPSEVLRLLI
jgi:hypothetical protein